MTYRPVVRKPVVTVVNPNSDGDEADGADDEAKMERALAKVALPDELDNRMKTNLYYIKQEMSRETKTFEEETLKRALAKFNWKIDDAVRYLKTGQKVHAPR